MPERFTESGRQVDLYPEGLMADDKTMREEGFEQEVKGTSREVKGKVQKNVGKLTGDDSEELEGRAKEAIGKVQKKTGQKMQDTDR
jgi:uncharacterized protein YjbJ (UPF0337 family)